MRKGGVWARGRWKGGVGYVSEGMVRGEKGGRRETKRRRVGKGEEKGVGGRCWLCDEGHGEEGGGKGGRGEMERRWWARGRRRAWGDIGGGSGEVIKALEGGEGRGQSKWQGQVVAGPFFSQA